MTMFLLPCVDTLNSHRTPASSRCLKLKPGPVTGAELTLNFFQATLRFLFYFHGNIHQPVVLQHCRFLLGFESLAL